MLYFWRIRYLDRRDKQFKDRDLWLDTGLIDPAVKVAIAAVYELTDRSHQRRAMLAYRNYFQETSRTDEELKALINKHGAMKGIFVVNYFEDENGNEMTGNDIAVVLTGNPEADIFSPDARPHDIEYMRAEKQPIAYDQLSLHQDQLDILGVFSRDLGEMIKSSFFKEGPGRLTKSPGLESFIETAVSDEEIRSFVTIFRRIYMEKEPANFQKAVTVYCESLGKHPLAEWAKAELSEYEKQLGEAPHFVPTMANRLSSFSRKRLIDVFIYTRYAHQPNQQRTRQYHECLSEVGGDTATLTWLYLSELHACALHIWNAGKLISNFYSKYCGSHRTAGNVLLSVNYENPRIGKLEKQDERRDRVIGEKIEELATILWVNQGSPDGGPLQFLEQAREQLASAMDGT